MVKQRLELAGGSWIQWDGSKLEIGTGRVSSVTLTSQEARALAAMLTNRLAGAVRAEEDLRRADS
jgi:hypothetical protein